MDAAQDQDQHMEGNQAVTDMEATLTASPTLSPNVKVHIRLQTCMDIVPAQAHRNDVTTITNNTIIEITKMITVHHELMS